MALVLIGRRLPVLHYLSALAAKRGDYVLSIYSDSNCRSSNSSSVESPPVFNTKPELGKDSSEKEAKTTTTSSTDGHPPTSTSQPTTVEDDDEWTEVVHSSGQLYYWNQRTGETTQLGEPKPKTDRSSGGGGGGAGGGSHHTHASAGTGRGAEGHVDPRAEAHLEDRTGTYAAMGVLIGAFLGWVSQFV